MTGGQRGVRPGDSQGRGSEHSGPSVVSLFHEGDESVFLGGRTAVREHHGAQLSLGECTLSNAQSRHGVRNLSLRIDEGEKSLCYSGDGAATDTTRELFRGASLLVHECYALSDAPNGHAAFDVVLPMADELGVETLCLVHLGRKDKAAISERARAQGVRVPAPGDTFQV